MGIRDVELSPVILRTSGMNVIPVLQMWENALNGEGMQQNWTFHWNNLLTLEPQRGHSGDRCTHPVPKAPALPNTLHGVRGSSQASRSLIVEPAASLL